MVAMLLALSVTAPGALSPSGCKINEALPAARKIAAAGA